ncbi:hypothetical protein Y1Q_0015717 [Alligator mississippiensis]|uniref:Uncharacterized protein n=1 Tax=Alligator mississippiensis TaxID=8496 RepID=A0A151NNW8_ALLMI|nr:hypothetical protein Y1Q_0015717 [Alligator mississippiensis]
MAMASLDALGQNPQVLTQFLVAQQQMMDQQQDWLWHSLASFKMLKMIQNDDPEAYIEAFECHAIMMGLYKVYWASQLGTFVMGKAQAAYQALPTDEACDYEQMKKLPSCTGWKSTQRITVNCSSKERSRRKVAPDIIAAAVGPPE